jgi:serine protease inhibitor
LPWLTLEHGTNDIVSTWGVAEAIICLAEGADLDLRKRLLASISVLASDYPTASWRPANPESSTASVLYAPNLLVTPEQVAALDHLRCRVVNSRDASAAIQAVGKHVELRVTGNRIARSLGAELGIFNASRFTRSWQQPFDVRATAPMQFQTLRGSVWVPFLRRIGEFMHHALDDAQVVRIPFRGGGVMAVYIPNVVGQLSETWERQTLLALNEMSTNSELVFFGMPKFSFSKVRQFGTVLSTAIPLTDSDRLFRWPARPLSATQVAEIVVDESGATVVAETAIKTTKRKRSYRRIFADRPFGFLLTGTEAGRVVAKGCLFDPRALG